MMTLYVTSLLVESSRILYSLSSVTAIPGHKELTFIFAKRGIHYTVVSCSKLWIVDNCLHLPVGLQKGSTTIITTVVFRVIDL